VTSWVDKDSVLLSPSNLTADSKDAPEPLLDYTNTFVVWSSYMRAAAIFVLSACAAMAQTESPVFDAVSVKPAEKGRGTGPLRGGPGTSSPGQLSWTASLRALLMRAYELKTYQIEGPAWMDSERYEIAAKIPAGATNGQVALMLQALLGERFRLAAHRETKELPIYALVVGKNGPKFQESPPAPAADDGTPARPVAPKLTRGADGFPDMVPGAEVARSYEVVVGGSDGVWYKLWARRETMQQLADRLSGQLNRAVVDRTELPRQYDFTLSWTMDGSGIPRTDPPPDQMESHSGAVLSDPGLSIFTAIQAQLGLKLEQRRGPLEMLIVEKVERIPTGN